MRQHRATAVIGILGVGPPASALCTRQRAGPGALRPHTDESR